MKKLVYNFSLLMIGAVIPISCSDGKRTDSTEITIEDKELPADVRAEKALYDEVMAIHDEVMPKMDDMMQLKGELQVKLDMAREKDGKDRNELSKLEERIKKLEEADEAMMQWMRDFEPQGDSVEHDQVMKYYSEQKEQIIKVKDMMIGAMDEARVVLGKNTSK